MQRPAHFGKLVHHVKDELLALLTTIVDVCVRLEREASQLLTDGETVSLFNDLSEAAGNLFHFSSEILASFEDNLQQDDFETIASKVRHDLKNKMNQVSGYRQVIELDKDSLPAPLRSEVAKLAQLCDRANTHMGYLGRPDSAYETNVNLKGMDLEFDIRDSDIVDVSQRKPEPNDILVVEDDETNADILRKLLKKDGHTVTVAVDGEQALQILSQKTFDLALLDFLLPKVNGLQLLKIMKSSAKLRPIPVIMISGLAESQGIVRAIELGAEDYLPKPIDAVLLRARIKACQSEKRLREHDLRQFFSTEMSRELACNPDLLKGQNANVSVLSCDIRRFSAISEKLGPAKTVEWVSESMGELSECVYRHNGVLIDYIGDELMAMWGAPKPQDDHADLACQAALDMLNCLGPLNKRWAADLGEQMKIGIGVNSGEAHVGVIGSRRKFKYGALGTTVNLASRVQGATKYLKSPLLVTDSTHALLTGDEFPARRLCRIRVVNIQQPCTLYEVFTNGGASDQDLVARYEQALTHFEAGEFERASVMLSQLMADHPHDAPGMLLMTRVIQQRLEASDDFDDVWTLPGK